MLARLAELADIPYYFQFTLNPYPTQFEKNLPPLDERIETLVKKSKQESPSRTGCNCMESIDIGTYNTCDNGWKKQEFAGLKISNDK